MLMINLHDFVRSGLSVAQVAAIRQEIAALQYALHLNERINKRNGRPRKPPPAERKKEPAAPIPAHASELPQEPVTEAHPNVGIVSPPAKPRWPDWDKISVGNVGDEERRVQTGTHQGNAGSVVKITDKQTTNFKCNDCGNRRHYDGHIPTVCPFCGSQDVRLGTNKGKENSKEGRGKDAKTQLDEGGFG